MRKKFIQRAAGVLSVGAVALAMGAAGAAPTPATATSTTGAASASGLTAKQNKAKKKPLKKCYKVKNKAKRKKCVKKVNKKYKKISKSQVKPKVAIKVGVNDDYFSPSGTTMKKGQAIKWVWNNANRNAHNVSLVSGPAGLTKQEKYDLTTPNSPAVGYTFGPKVLNKTGTYNFVCSLHSTVMYMSVKVTK
jgi:plastocyanin